MGATTNATLESATVKAQQELISMLQDHRRGLVKMTSWDSATVQEADKLIAQARQVYGELVFGATHFERLTKSLSIVPGRLYG